MRKRWIGRSILGIGVLHSLFGFVFTRATLAQLVGEGLWNTVNGQPDREATFWFLLSGFLIILIGLLVDWIEGNAEHFPGFLGWSLLALTILCVFIMPISGGWLLFLPAVGSIVRSRPQSVIEKKDSNMIESEYTPEYNKLWSWMFHEDNLFTSRVGVFLIGHGLLITAATIAVKSKPLLTRLAIFGVFLAIIWLLENLRGARNVSVLCEFLKSDPTFRAVRPKIWQGCLGKIPRVELMAWLLPCIAILGWVAVLLWMSFAQRRELGRFLEGFAGFQSFVLFVNLSGSSPRRK